MTFPVTGFVLAGGKSSRMGTDKALLELGGKTLTARAVEKLRAVCEEVFILTGDPALASYAPTIPDVHPDCGPIGGIEAGLAHAKHPWSLFLAVDMPFIPISLLQPWVQTVLATASARIALFTVDDVPQPTLTLIHRDVAPYLQQSIECREYKLLPALYEAARHLAQATGSPLDSVLLDEPIGDVALFANLNTPDEFRQAKDLSLSHAGAPIRRGFSHRGS